MKKSISILQRGFLLFCMLVIAITGPTVHAVDVDYDFYAGNDILYYDPNAGDVCGKTSESWKTVTTEEKIGQILYVGFNGDNLDKLAGAVKKYQLGGVYLNSGIKPSNFSLDTIKQINSSVQTDLIIATDDEGGQVYRMLDKGDQPSAKELGTMTKAQVLAAGKDTGTKLKKMGVNAVLAPVLDIDTGLKNAISPYDRSFSKDPAVIIDKASTWADGVSSSNVGVTFKHFPGIGGNVGNTDEQYVEMKTSLANMSKDLSPYNDDKIKNRESSSVMLANFVLPEWGADPVSINKKAVDYLRNTVKFNGLIVTDDISVMEKSSYGSHKISLEQSVTKALNAGVDMPLFTYPGDAKMDAIISTVKNNVSTDKIDAAYQTSIDYKTSLGLNSTARATNTTQEQPTTTPVVSGNDNSQKIYNFLISTSFKGLGNKPFNAVQAAGALGNFYQESGYRFNAIQNGKSESGFLSAPASLGGYAGGIAQWDSDRRITLINLAKSMNKDWKDAEVQFQMIKNELDGSEGERLAAFEGGEFLTTTDPKRASYLFMKSYERAGTPVQKTRDDEAARMYEKYKNLTPGQAFSTEGCAAGTVTGKSDGSKATFVTKDGYAVYIQTDPRWTRDPYSTTTIGIAGCGPTSMTMILTAITGKAVDIHDVIKVSADAGMYVPGAGSSWLVGPTVAKHYGLKATKLPHTVEAVNQAVRAGGIVLMSGRGPVPFTAGGHYIHIRGIASDGKWMIGDSAHKDANEKSWDPNFILSYSADNFYSITK